MKRASQLFTEGDRQKIVNAIAEAESKTAGEIVPVVATSSGRYDRGEDLFGVVVALLAVTLAWIFFQDVRPLKGDWTAGFRIVLGLIPVLIITLAGFVAGAAIATRFPILKLPFVSRKEMLEEVDRAAAEAFHRFRIRRTAAGTGILIYISLFERMVRVLGDDTIAEKLKQEDWNKVCSLVTESLAAGRPVEGLSQAILTCGELLSGHFPIQPDDKNELTNELHVID